MVCMSSERQAKHEECCSGGMRFNQPAIHNTKASSPVPSTAVCFCYALYSQTWGMHGEVTEPQACCGGSNLGHAWRVQKKVPQKYRPCGPASHGIALHPRNLKQVLRHAFLARIRFKQERKRGPNLESCIKNMQAH
eukprot:scaffold118427_cov18-Tisochrysis_lutea.AAC.1